jgi:hypothetical protein
MRVPDHAVKATADLIQQYLTDHPDAADTSNGIRAWWLTGVSTAIVEAALADLVNRGIVRRREVPGASPVYSRAQPPR